MEHSMLRNCHEFNDINPNPKSQKNNKPTKGKKKPIKIKYISSPMMVRANNASEFRAIVQELTGQNSNVSELSSEDFVGHDQYYDHDDQVITSTRDHHGYPKPHHGHELAEYDHYDHDKYFSNPNSTDSSVVSFGAQFDDQDGHFWRSEVVSDQSFNSEFQSPCVFV